MAALFSDIPRAVSNTLVIAERCRFDLGYGLQDLPHFPTRHGMSSSAYLRRLCHEAVPRRYGGEPPTNVNHQLQHELRIIEQAGLAFLSAETGYVPQNTVAIGSKDDAAKILKLVNILEENEDVQNVYANYEMPDEWMEELG